MPATPEAHIDAIRALQNAANDQESFVSFLPILIGMEGAFSPDLIALYVYYCVLALDLTKPSLRASAVGMLVVVAEQNPAPILALIPKLHALAEEGWWETHAQLGRLCAALLSPSLAPHFAEAPDDAAAIVTLLTKILANRQPAAQMVVLSFTAPILETYPQLLAPFIESLLDLHSDQRSALLDTTGAITNLAKAGGGQISLVPLPSSWPGVLVAKDLMSTARARALDTLEVPYTEVLSSLLPLAKPEEADQWVEWLCDPDTRTKDYLYVALCDEEALRADHDGLTPSLCAAWRGLAEDLLHATLVAEDGLRQCAHSMLEGMRTPTPTPHQITHHTFPRLITHPLPPSFYSLRSRPSSSSTCMTSASPSRAR